MSDLLPPSPSALTHSSRPFNPSPSALSSSVAGESFFTDYSKNAAASSSSLSLPQIQSPASIDLRLKPGSSLSHTYINGTSSMPASIDTWLGPPVHPLDYRALIHSPDSTLERLAQTVDDLTQWLSVVEVGFTAMLEKSKEESIAEEQEQEDSAPENYSNGHVNSGT
ncbi:hypothetical protein SERLADRAFT_387511 [Serpula lacrymans var. lacrymans S7.9]|uniref:Uncharacterized protein n=1 Tax=Serpula lacrymans var. lacrymans (strain S7.9) TaxID=578457 RepID=F8NT05_SERL9|nr:uncharacterized protein SERLADRAFT_387511 [Serpula lacrymans var. lacrymans S7.9]EGO25478.1 hypothetical protein SERLADRAFT_387511 [Serpula lacrymans var. lacrymans S7.9]